MKFPCDYHGLNSAQWRCEPCRRFFCRECVPCGNETFLRQGGAKCALCFKKLDYLGSAVDAKPPTQEILNCLKYPLQSGVLFILVPVALLMVLFTFGTGGALISLTIVPFLALFTLSFEFASTIFLARCQGQAEAPSLGSIGNRPDLTFFLRHVVLALIGVTLVTALGYWLGLIIYLLVLPAAVMVLADERSLMSALNPAHLVRMISALGSHYWIGCGFCAVMVACTAIAIAYIPVAWPFLLLYSLYACYAYLGYLYYFHQYELGARVPEYEDAFIGKMEFEKRRALSDSFILYKENELDRAREVLRDGFKRCNDDLELHLQYHKVLLATSDVEAQENHGNFLLDRLLLKGTSGPPGPGAAAKVYLDTLQKLPEFKPRLAETCYALAQQLRKQHKPQAAIQALKEFHLRYPSSDKVPEAYILAAEIFHRELADNKKAKTLLNFMLLNGLGGDFKEQITQFQSQLS